MSKQILIVDDDAEFNRLLTGVFSQAGHTVLTAESAEEGERLHEENAVDLVVTDMRLPRSSGLDFVHKVRQKSTGLPVVMVSGYLDDDAIRQLIREGVNGIFLKPLNIFSLLKKANQLLENAEHRAGSGQASAESLSIGPILGASEASKSFLRRLRELADFRRTLLLIGPAGSPMEEIAAKVAALGENPWRFVALRAGGLGAEQLEAALGGSEEPTVLAFLEADALAEQEATAIMDFVEGKGGSGAGLRTIFCLSQPVEDLYDAGKIDEEFYLFLGTNELRVPALREMPEDMLQYVQEEVDPEGGQRLDMKTRQLLLGHSWPENFMELQSVVLRAISAARPLKPDHKHFHAALYPEGEGAGGSAGAAEPDLGRFLRAERDRYAEALRIFNS